MVQRTSITRRLIVAVVLSQSLLAAGLLVTHVFYTHRRVLAALDAGIQARAMSVAALVRYTEDATGNVYFDDTLMPEALDVSHPDLFAVWADRSGLVTRSEEWPRGLKIGLGTDLRWDLEQDGVPYRALRLAGVPVLDREEGAAFQPQTLTIVYLSPEVSMKRQVERSGEFIALASVLLLGVTVPLALWGIRRGLTPLRELTAQAAQVSGRNWEFRPPEQAAETEELRPLTDAMATMVARLRQSFEQQREFIGNAAHELKTPVAVVKSTLQSLQHRPRSSEEYREGVGHALEDLERLERLLQWMLRLARAEQWAHGTARPDLQKVDVSATCAEAIDRVRGLAEARRARVEFVPNGKLWLRADPEDLQTVWVNLLENAVRYSPEGSAVEVKVQRGEGGRAVVTFADHGRGIAAEELPHIFERFYRGDPSRTRATGGFGLGLAIVKALVEAYGGTISAESEPGAGTRMKVELPVEGPG